MVWKGRDKNLNYSRQAKLIKPSEIGNVSISLVGVGATGSYVALALAQMGWGNSAMGQGKLKVFDGDVVEEHNLANQVYGISHIGMPKVDALNDVIKQKCGFGIETYNKMVEGNVPEVISNYIFLLTDTMASRREIFDGCLIRNNYGVDMVIETRMGLRDGRVYAFTPSNLDHVKAWESSLYSDEDAERSACGTSSSVITTVMHLASIATSRVVHHFHQTKSATQIKDISEGTIANELHFALYPEGYYINNFDDSEPKFI